MIFILLFLSVCAVYRLALMGSSEEGPAAIFARLRRKVPAKTNPGRGIRCYLCWTVWTGALCAGYLLWLGEITPWLFPLYWLGFSGGAVALHLFTKNG